MPKPLKPKSLRAKAAVGWLMLLLAITPALANAQAGAKCEPHGSPDAVLACAVREAQQSDTELQLRYSALMNHTPASERPALRKAHTAWMRERDRLCRQRAEAHTGSAWTLHLQRCLRQENLSRQTHVQPTFPAPPRGPSSPHLP